MDLESKKWVLHLNEDRLAAWLVFDLPTVVRDNLEGSLEQVRRLRGEILAEEADFHSELEDYLRPWL